MNKLCDYYMSLALKEAQKSLKTGDIPVGCIIVLRDEIIAKAHNTKEKDKNPLRHAEMIAIDKAVKKVQQKRLTNAEIYITMEPCTMCLSAIAQAEIKEIYYGVKNKMFGGITNSINLLEEFTFTRKPQIFGGIKEKECFDSVKKFFEFVRK